MLTLVKGHLTREINKRKKARTATIKKIKEMDPDGTNITCRQVRSAEQAVARLTDEIGSFEVMRQEATDFEKLFNREHESRINARNQLRKAKESFADLHLELFGRK